MKEREKVVSERERERESGGGVGRQIETKWQIISNNQRYTIGSVHVVVLLYEKASSVYKILVVFSSS